MSLGRARRGSVRCSRLQFSDLYTRLAGTFAGNCLLARRLAQRDGCYTTIVRMGWDMHNGIVDRLPASCREVDQPPAGLISDLKQRRLLDDTLVVFSRTSFAQESPTRYTLTRGCSCPACCSISRGISDVQNRGFVVKVTRLFQF